MPRSSMGLTFEDLRLLSQILKAIPTSKLAAAKVVGLDRARLDRLIQRVNEQIGEDLDWRSKGRFYPPPEARRLVAAFERFDSELTGLTGSPRLSAGTSVSLLLLAFLQQQGRSLERFAFFRSRQVLDALLQDEIDLAFLHGESIGFTAGRDKQRVASKLEAVSVIEWNAKIICPKNQSKQGILPAVIEWESGSTGERLAQIITQSNELSSNSLRVRCRSFLESIELVRRGLVGQAVVPDIYLRSVESDLRVLTPEKLHQGDLIAIYRTDERSRWEWLLDKTSWEKVVNRA